MKNQKGVTLVEVLAVIALIAIVGTITVPFINNIIVNARKDALVDSAYGLVDAAKQYRVNAIANRTTRSLSVDYTNKVNVNALKTNGKLPDAGSLQMDKDGNITLALWSDKAKTCVTKASNSSKVIKSDKSKANCHL